MFVLPIVALLNFSCTEMAFIQEEEVRYYNVKESKKYDAIRIECSTYWVEILMILIANKERTRVSAYVLEYWDDLIYPIDMDKIVMKRNKLSLKHAQQIYPTYDLNEENYGLL